MVLSLTPPCRAVGVILLLHHSPGVVPCVLCYRSHRAAVRRQTDRKVALSLKKLQVSKRSGGRNVARGVIEPSNGRRVDEASGISPACVP